jgi:hypothetical protein
MASTKSSTALSGPMVRGRLADEYDAAQSGERLLGTVGARTHMALPCAHNPRDGWCRHSNATVGGSLNNRDKPTERAMIPRARNGGAAVSIKVHLRHSSGQLVMLPCGSDPSE